MFTIRPNQESDCLRIYGQFKLVKNKLFQLLNLNYIFLVRCWDDRLPGTVMTVHNAHDSAVTCLRFDNQRIVSGSVDRTIKMWTLDTGKCLQTIDWKGSEGHTGVVRCLQTDLWRIVSASDDKTIKVSFLRDKFKKFYTKEVQNFTKL